MTPAAKKPVAKKAPASKPAAKKTTTTAKKPATRTTAAAKGSTAARAKATTASAKRTATSAKAGTKKTETAAKTTITQAQGTIQSAASDVIEVLSERTTKFRTAADARATKVRSELDARTKDARTAATDRTKAARDSAERAANIQVGAVLIARDEVQGRVDKAVAFFTSKADRTKQLKKFEKRGKTQLTKTERELKARRDQAVAERNKAIDRARAQVSDVRETVGTYTERVTAPVADTRKAVERRFRSAA